VSDLGLHYFAAKWRETVAVWQDTGKCFFIPLYSYADAYNELDAVLYRTAFFFKQNTSTDIYVYFHLFIFTSYFLLSASLISHRKFHLLVLITVNFVL